MKAAPKLPTVSIRDVLRTGAASVVRAKTAPRATATVDGGQWPDGGVIRVENKALGISIPCALAAVAEQLEQFLRR